MAEVAEAKRQTQEPGLKELNVQLEKASAEERVRWALERFQPHIMLSTSFGAQSAVSLHLVTQQWPEIPVVLIDTGYLFPETYKFADQLTERLKLNLKVYRPELSPAWREMRFGKLWEQGAKGIALYNQIHKVAPMQWAIRQLHVRGWIAGLRRQQSQTRLDLGVLQMQNDVMKIHPIIDWTDRQVYQYLKKYDLPYHPLWEKGYVSIGDTHTTRPLSADVTEEQTRFFGLKRECGLHDSGNLDPGL
jgi:phosphoadenosine phosphosulfate reductase